jgi:hypothetical protein
MRKFTWMMLAVVLSAGAARADVWDATAQYSNTNGNPNGDWSYGAMQSGAFSLMTSNDAGSGGTLWSHTGNGANMWLNTGSPAYGVPTGWLSVHPASSYEAALVRWTAPAAIIGSASVVGEFLAGDSGVMTVAVLKNGDFGSPLWTASDAGSFNLLVPVAPGDTIDFAVYNGYAYGNTPLDATITASTTAVPEPAGVVLGLFAAGLLVARRRAA